MHNTPLTDIDPLSHVPGQHFARGSDAAGVSSAVSITDEENGAQVLKFSRRDQPERALTDLAIVQKKYGELTPETLILEFAGGTLVIQDRIEGRRFKDIPPAELRQIIEQSPIIQEQLQRLLRDQVRGALTGQRHVDPVGYIADPRLENSINLFITNAGELKMCDIGLIPHTDSVQNLRNLKTAQLADVLRLGRGMRYVLQSALALMRMTLTGNPIPYHAEQSTAASVKDLPFAPRTITALAGLDRRAA